jgi:hypothetical protein
MSPYKIGFELGVAISLLFSMKAIPLWVTLFVFYIMKVF